MAKKTDILIDRKTEAVKELVNEVMRELGLTWQKWDREVIKAAEVVPLKEFRTGKITWSKIIRGNLGQRNSLLWWDDIGRMAEHIRENYGEQNNVEPVKGSNKDFVRYSVSKLQETILPILFRYAYELRHKIEWQHNLDWNKCLDAFESDSIDVALHNFPTVLAYQKEMVSESPLFFWPFLYFNGYAILIKKSVVNWPGKTGTKFADLDRIERISLLENNIIALERNTDIEWVFKKFCEKFKCNWEIVEEKIKDLDINSGKKEFKEHSEIGIYVTNYFHACDLIRNKDEYEIISTGSNLTQHHNYSGLVCTMEYFDKNRETIKDLIDTWFNTIENFRTMWDYIDDTDPISNFHIHAMLKVLNETMHAEMNLEELVNSYRKSNTFFRSPGEAMDSFMFSVLNNESVLLNNFEISAVQTRSSFSKVDTETISAIKQHIKDLRAKLKY